MRYRAEIRPVGRRMVALGVLLGALCGYCADTARWVGPSNGVVSEGTNWDPEGTPTREMLFTGDAVGKTVVFDSQVVLASDGNASVGSTNETDAALFTTDGATWNCVVWKASDPSYGLTAPLSIYVADRGEFSDGALRIESGTYTAGTQANGRGISVGRTGKGYFELAGGTLNCKGDACFSCERGGTAVIGSNAEGAAPAVVDVVSGKWTYLAVNDAPGSVTIRKSGTLKTSYISDKAKNTHSTLTLDGGTLCHSGFNQGNAFVPVPIRLTANGGTLDTTVAGVFANDIVDDDPDSTMKGTLVKKGAGTLTFTTTKSYAGLTDVQEGKLVLAAGVQLGSLKIAEGAGIEIDMTLGTLDGNISYPLFKAGAAVPDLPEGKSLTDVVTFINAASFNVELTKVEDVWMVVGSVKEDSAVARNVTTGEYFSTLAGAVAKAESDQTIQLLKSALVHGNVPFGVTGATNMTLNLNGHTLTREGTDCVIEFAGSTVISNGTILANEVRKVGGSAFLSLPENKNAVLTVVDVNVGNENGYDPYCMFNLRQKSSVNISNGIWRVATLASGYYDSGKIEISGGRFYLRGWHTDAANYRKTKIVLSGGLYALAPRASYAAEEYVVQHRPGEALPYAVVPAGTPGLVKPEGWSFAYADQATADASVVAQNGTTSYASLADAVRAASAGDTVELVADVLALPEAVTIDKGLTLEGNGHLVRVPRVFVDESGYVTDDYTLDFDAVIVVTAEADAALRNLRVMGGGKIKADTEGGNFSCIDNFGTLLMENVTVTRSNGGVYNNEGAKLYMDNCRLVRNCRFCGGGLYNHGTAVMVRSSLSENRSLSNGGGGGAAENSGTLYVNNCVICNNSSTEIGGAINNYSSQRDVKLYMMNTTLSGNFSASENDSYAGGVGLRASGHLGYFYGVNNLICNNYWYKKSDATLRTLDIGALENDLKEMKTDLRYTLFQTLKKQGKTTDETKAQFTIENCVQLSAGEAAADVFQEYYASPRTYQNSVTTTKDINGAQLVSKDDGSLNAEIARYAPIKREGGKAVLGTDGVYTYFDASNWKAGEVKMSYRTVAGGAQIGDLTQATGEMIALDSLPVADESAMVTNYYESASGRSFGVAGASGWLESETKYYTVALGGEIQGTNPVKVVKGQVTWGSVAGVTLYGDSYAEGETVTLTATPGFSRAFLGWYAYAADGTTLEKLSDAAVWTLQVTRNLTVFPAFSELSKMVEPAPKVHVVMNAGEPPLFPINVTTKWMVDNYPGYVEAITGKPAAEAEAYITGLLEQPDATTGLKKWQEYVLGITPGDVNGRIWIDSPQYKSVNGNLLRFKMNELTPVEGSGFTLLYRLNSRLGDAADFTRGVARESSVFDVNVAADPSGLYRIDIIFVPDGEAISEEFVTTVNTAGVLRVASAADRAALAAPWTKLTPSAAAPVEAVNLVKTMNLTTGDKLYVYDGANKKYRAFQLRESGQWEALAVYALDANGNINWTAAAAAKDSSVARGVGFWLERQNTEGYVYLVGQSDGSSEAVTTPLVAGWNLVGNPQTAAFDFTALAPKSGDRIVVPTAGEPKNLTWENNGWGYYKSTVFTTKSGRKYVKPVWTTDDNGIPAGTAFWYISASGASTLDWTNKEVL